MVDFPFDSSFLAEVFGRGRTCVQNTKLARIEILVLMFRKWQSGAFFFPLALRRIDPPSRLHSRYFIFLQCPRSFSRIGKSVLTSSPSAVYNIKVLLGEVVN